MGKLKIGRRMAIVLGFAATGPICYGGQHPCVRKAFMRSVELGLLTEPSDRWSPVSLTDAGRAALARAQETSR